jgi:hypothetical protein
MAVEMKLVAPRNVNHRNKLLVEAISKLEQAINAVPEGFQADAVRAGAQLIVAYTHEARLHPETNSGERPEPSAISLLTEGAMPSTERQAAQEAELLKRSFAWRRQVLDATLSNTAVADLLGVTRQTPHDRVTNRTLLAIKDYRGANRYPIWQFDPDGPGGVVDGLPNVLAALAVTPIEQVGWLIRANPMLDGRTPIEALKLGQREAVIALANAVGVR